VTDLNLDNCNQTLQSLSQVGEHLSESLARHGSQAGNAGPPWSWQIGLQACLEGWTDSRRISIFTLSE